MTESLSDLWAAAHPLAGQSLYSAAAERDSCGVAFVATLRGTPGRDIVDAGLTALLNLDHRGAFGEDMNAGDGAGILTQIPDAFLRDVIPGELPPAGFYAVGTAFLPVGQGEARRQQDDLARLADEEGLRVLAWRDVPVTPDLLGEAARKSIPFMRQLVVTAEDGGLQGVELDRLTYRLRKRAEHELGLFFASLSARTLVYKGMLTTTQLEPFFPDLSDPRYASEIALVHARFSTSTEASWTQAQPMRFVAHNGEFTSVRGNRDWMRGREGNLEANVLGDITPLLPVHSANGSDSMSFDETVELLHLDGRSLPHAILMLLPEAWEADPEMGPDRRAFYDYHASIAEPWDGPACLNFTDGTVIGTVLDRNALRPARFWVTEDGLVVLASETGVLDIDPATVVRKGRVEPGRMFLVDTRQGRIIEDEESKASVATRRPYAQWLAEHELVLDQLVELGTELQDAGPDRPGQGVLAASGEEPAAEVNFFDRFRPVQARVTTAPLEPGDFDLEAVLRSAIGPEPNFLAETAAHARKLILPLPILDDTQLNAILRSPDSNASGLRATRVPALFVQAHGGAGLDEALSEVCAAVDEALEAGGDVVVLSDRETVPGRVPIPSLLVLAAVHRHLIGSRRRGAVSLIVECGDARDGQDVACLLAFGAAAVHPYEIGRTGGTGSTSPDMRRIGTEIADLMFAFGTSTLKSYRGAQGFASEGLSQDVLDRFFPGAPGWAGTHGMDGIATAVASGSTDAPADPVIASTPGVPTWGKDREAVLLSSVEPTEELRARFVLEPRSGEALVRICPHRNRIDLDQLMRAATIQIEFAECDCVGAGPEAAHLDAVSLEDVAQLIHDLKNANPDADVQVVLPAQQGVGALAAGAVKAHSDSVIICADGSGRKQQQSAGILAVARGLRETQETLVRHGLRGRTRLGVASVFESAHDVATAAVLGAEIFVSSGSPILLDELIESVRVLLASLGRHRLTDLLGQHQLLSIPSDVVDQQEDGPGTPGRQPELMLRAGQDHGLERALDHQLVTDSVAALTGGERVWLDVPIRNVNRSVGTLLGREVTKRFTSQGLDDNTITVTLTGSAGQSLGAFLPRGITLHLFGDANDFVAKGLCGGRIIVRPDMAAVLTGPNNVIAGNVIGYGATSGEVFLRGTAGDRFAARNQGADFVVEGVGNNACQDMTAGTVVVLGATGRELGANMTGGVIYALDLRPSVTVGWDEATHRELLSDDDIATILDLLRRHQEATGSTLASELLEDVAGIAERFTRISSPGRGPDRISRVGSAREEL